MKESSREFPCACVLLIFCEIVSTEHILAAVFRAANDYLNRRLKSHNVHSEIVFALSPNNNVSLLSASFSEPVNYSIILFSQVC